MPDPVPIECLVSLILWATEVRDHLYFTEAQTVANANLSVPPRLVPPSHSLISCARVVRLSHSFVPWSRPLVPSSTSLQPIRASATTCSMFSGRSVCEVLFPCARLPLTHIRQARRIMNDSFVLTTFMTLLYRCSVFAAILWTRCLWKRSHSGDITPLREKTSGVKVPCSTFMMRSLYWRFMLLIPKIEDKNGKYNFPFSIFHRKKK